MTHLQQHPEMSADAPRQIYLDHAATTPTDPAVVQAMLPYFTAHAGNPSSVHSAGRAAAQGLESARRAVARVLGCRSREVVFTGGGSEADNLAIKGVAYAHRAAGHATSHIISIPIEHHAVTHTLDHLAAEGFAVTQVPVDNYGRVSVAAIAAAIRPDTCLITVMYANNEIGTVQPIAAIGALARAHGIPLHSDAVQAGGYLPLNVDALGVDLLTLTAHKFYGPKGVGLLYVRSGRKLHPMIHGGAQEHGLRAGTENVPGIVGLAAALTQAVAHAPTEVPRVTALRDRLIAGIQAQVPGAYLQGHPTERLPNNVAFCIAGVTGEDLLLRLDLAGICASSGSACNSGSTAISHVLRAIGTPPELGRGSLRLTLGSANTEADVDYTIAALTQIVADLRAYAPAEVAVG
ncbi:MAG: cysteine desulfurase [Chloroflexota bacterium]|nr:cysteine desulfurase [Chloroflexota bacterium]